MKIGIKKSRLNSKKLIVSLMVTEEERMKKRRVGKMRENENIN